MTNPNNMLKAELVDYANALEVQVKTLKEQREDFEKKILHGAGMGAYDHEMCHALEDVLGKIGIAIPNVDVTIASTQQRTYRVPLTEAYRMGFYSDANVPTDPETLASEVNEALTYGELKDYLVPESLTPDAVTTVTLQQV